MPTKLKIELLFREIKQKQVATLAGVDRAYISRIVNGKQKPSSKVIEAFKTFGIEIKNDQNS